MNHLRTVFAKYCLFLRRHAAEHLLNSCDFSLSGIPVVKSFTLQFLCGHRFGFITLKQPSNCSNETAHIYINHNSSPQRHTLLNKYQAAEAILGLPVNFLACRPQLYSAQPVLSPIQKHITFM